MDFKKLGNALIAISIVLLVGALFAYSQNEKSYREQTTHIARLLTRAAESGSLTALEEARSIMSAYEEKKTQVNNIAIAGICFLVAGSVLRYASNSSTSSPQAEPDTR